MNIILASSSVAREKLLKDSDFTFDIIPHLYDEDLTPYVPDQLLSEYVLYVVKKKSEYLDLKKIAHVSDNKLCVICADTMVLFKNKIVGKPQSLAEAREWLMQRIIKNDNDVFSLCGTAFILKIYEKNENNELILKDIHEEYVETKVWYGFYDESDVNEYMNHYNERLLAIAGGFTVAGYGKQFIHSIKGSYTNIIGLPVFELRRAMKKLEVF